MKCCRKVITYLTDATRNSDGSQHIGSRGCDASGSPASPLLPELSQLQHLETLFIVLPNLGPWPSIPPEWLTPGQAFPRLKW